MAFVYRHPGSKNWFARFRLPNGQYASRSTGTTDRKLAKKLAEKFELPADRLMTEAQARKVIEELYKLIHGEELPSATLSEFMETWLNRKKVELAPQSYERYQDICKKLKTFLGEKADRPIMMIRAADLIAFRDHLAQRLSPVNANCIVKIIRVIFKAARIEGLVLENVAERVLGIRIPRNSRVRRPFTMEELQALLKVADGEWRGMIFCGIYTGQRLGDIATLDWSSVDLEHDEIRLITHKTGRNQCIPIHTTLREYFEGLKSRKGPVFPKSNEKVRRFGKTAPLSREFYDIMVKTGLAQKRRHRRTGMGCSTKRRVHEISFHSLRHTATSLMKNAGVNSAVVMDIIGHESKAVSDGYTHVDLVAKRDALKILPKLI